MVRAHRSRSTTWCRVLLGFGCIGGVELLGPLSCTHSEGGEQPPPPWPVTESSFGSTGSSDTDPAPSAGESGSATDGVAFDVGSSADGTGGDPVDECKVGNELDGVGQCDDSAPPDAFEPEVQWAWDGPEHGRYSSVTPLVANLTDDNGDGEIDLCDVPDVVVVAGSYDALVNYGGASGRIFVLDGATGSLHFEIATDVAIGVTPALGDIDGDGRIEIVTTTPDSAGAQLIAFDHDGSEAWTGASVPGQMHAAVALGDLDNDGDVEIVAERQVVDHQGTLLWSAAETSAVESSSATVLADLDADGDLEVVFPSAAFHHDGSLLWQSPDTAGAQFAQVADLDDDEGPEVLVTGANGLSLLDHDGSVLYLDRRPTGVPAGGGAWARAAAIHDFDGDGQAEYAMSSQTYFSVYEGDASVVWSAEVLDSTGLASGTAFDFLGDGTPEAMFADEESSYVFDGAGIPYVQSTRTSRTWIEYPVVADVDNDGSAEIVIVSNISLAGNAPSSTVQVIRDQQDRWVRARRIWNQHTYHVTNVREDGTIPQFEPPHWNALNTFRTQAQISAGGVCNPAGDHAPRRRWTVGIDDAVAAAGQRTDIGAAVDALLETRASLIDHIVLPILQCLADAGADLEARDERGTQRHGPSDVDGGPDIDAYTAWLERMGVRPTRSR